MGMTVDRFFFASAGESLIDLIQGADGRFEPCLGGSVYNFCIALARQGVPSAYANPLSEDIFGQRFRARLEADHVRLMSPAAVPQPTSLAVVAVDAEGKPAYAFHRSNVADRSFDLDALLPQLAQARALHLGCFALVPADVDRYLAMAERVSAAGGFITMDANLRSVVEPDLDRYVASVDRALPVAHVVKVSDEDLLNLRRVASVDDVAALVEAARELLTRSERTQIVALTLGARGAVLLARDGVALRAEPPSGIAVADTVGAGDCFFAALNASLWVDGAFTAQAGLRATPEMLRTALARGIAGATVNIARVGCNPGTWDEVSEQAARVTVRTL